MALTSCATSNRISLTVSSLRPLPRSAQTSRRSESDIRVNYWNTNKIIAGSNNIGGYRSAEADRLSRTLRTAANADDRRVALHALESLIARDRPFVLLWYADLAYAYRPAAYDGWRFQAGQGLLHKLSFVRLAGD